MVAMVVQVASPASPPSPSTGRVLLGRTRSAAARAIASSSSTHDGNNTSTDAHETTLPGRSLFGALSTLTGGASARLLPPPPPPARAPSAVDIEAQASAAAAAAAAAIARHKPSLSVDDHTHFAIGDAEEDEEPASSRHPFGRPPPAAGPHASSFSSSSSRAHMHSKLSDSSSEHDRIGSRHAQPYDAYGLDDEDDDDETQYAAMAEPGSEYSNLLQLKPIAPSGPSQEQLRQSNGSAFKPPGRLRGEDRDEHDDGEGALRNEDDFRTSDNGMSPFGAKTRGEGLHSAQYSDRTAALSTPHTTDRLLSHPNASDATSPATAMAPTVIPFERMSRGEKTWMWIVTGLVTLLVVVAMLISEDVIDWPGDGIGKD
ncbi:hypothetical protein OC835_004718 [Tilletia horrida]|nr:hypothetical protein OC835_004718 [Tilletia horrida]